MRGFSGRPHRGKGNPMKTKKFWNWKKVKNQETGAGERILELSGTIAEESWFDDEVTPQLFRDELNSGAGDITVWINSPGGDCVAAAQIYNMLSNYKGKVTVKIDGIAASAASVIAMAGDTVLVSPVSMLMIHNPATIAFGDHAEMQKAIDMLAEVKESIINAYVLKTGLSRPKLSHLMDAETWMDANKAVELGFADDVMARAKAGTGEEEPGEGEESEADKKKPSAHGSMLFSRRAVDNALLNKVIAKCGEQKPKQDMQTQAKIPAPEERTIPETETGRSVDALMERLHLLRH